MMPTIIVNGSPHTCEAGATVLAVLQQLHVSIPTLCHDDRLMPTGACRSCLVEVGGHARPLPACTTLVEDGMVINTDTEALVHHRHTLLRMLALQYPTDVVQREPEREFHSALLSLDSTFANEIASEDDLATDRVEARDQTARAPERQAEPDRATDHSHPYIWTDMTRCIDCYRCVRICNEVQGQGVWHVRGRGHQTRIVADAATLLESSCVSCGACVDTCPTGALQDAASTSAGAPSTWTRTVCPYCGTGCELSVGARDGAIVSVRPVLDSLVSKGHLCAKGRYAYGFGSADDRVTTPMIRLGGTWQRCSWAEATAYVAERLTSLIDTHGPDAIGVLGSARATNEDNYLSQKFARVAIGTNNVDCCARVCHAPSAVGLKTMLGAGLATNSFDDIERAGALMVYGANATENHPIVGARIRQAARRGTPLIVVDPRRIELASEATVHLAIRPGTNVALLNAMAHVIVGEGLCDREFLASRVEGADAFARWVSTWPPSRAAEICGVAPEAIVAAARMYASGRPSMIVHGLGVTEHVQGTDGVMGLVNLALLTGNIGKPGSGVNPLRGQNNVQGSAHMGCEPGTLPGSTSIDAGRDACEREWGRPVPHSTGLTMLEMMDRAAAGRLKALWTIGYDVLLTNPNVNATRRSLQALDLVIIQDLFLTETAKAFGSVFLPACSPFEKDGTFMNAERRIQRVRAVLPPAGDSRPDWQIVAGVAQAMHVQGFDFNNANEIWDEVRRVSLGARGMSYERLDAGGLQWPCPALDHPGTSILHVDGFPGGGRAALRCLECAAPSDACSSDFPFVLITGRSLYQFNAGTMTGRTPNNDLRPSDLLDIAPMDAQALDLHNDDAVRVVSRYGTTTLPARITTEVGPGQLFATFQTPATWLNLVTSPYRDARTGTPEYKVTAVRIERVRVSSR